MVELQSIRCERKYCLSADSHNDLESIILRHPALFKKTYPARQINNIYFDTPDFNAFMDNIDGNSHREKIRIRWYGSDFPRIKNPVLEIKTKIGLAGGKIQRKLNSFEFSMETLFHSIKNTIVNDIFDFKCLKPAIMNKYSRKYFISNDGNFRITIDTGLKYCQIRNTMDDWLFIEPEIKHTIMELKYHPNVESVVSTITNYFPFRVVKSSKYANGVCLLYGT